MKIECTVEKLLSAVSKAEKITGKNLTLPVLSCLLLEAKGNTLKIIATNLDLGVEIIVPANITEEGTVAVPGNVLNSLISNNFKKGNIKLEKKGDNLVVLTENNSTVINLQANADFPTIPKLNKGESFLIDAKKLNKGLRSVWYSSSTSNIKPELSSILIYSSAKDITFVATDSFRLAEMKIDTASDKQFEQILIPFKNVAEILKIFDNIEGNIKVYLTKNQIAFEYENIYLTSRIIDGVFPDYQQLIPKEFKTDVTVLKEDLINSLKISNIFSDQFNKLTFKINPSKKIFEIVAKNNSVGETLNKIEGVLNGDEIEISFNQKYIIDCFQSIDSDSLVLNFNGSNKPLVIKGVPDSRFTYLVMPMNS